MIRSFFIVWEIFTKKKLFFTLLVFTMLFLSCDSSTGGETFKPSGAVFIVNTPTWQDEANQVIDLISRIVFFDGYLGNISQLSLPNDPLVNSLISKVREGGSLDNTDIEQLGTRFRDQLFNENDYTVSLPIINNAARIADQQISIFEDYNRKWGLFIPPNYNIILSLYGPGGQYDPRNGDILFKVPKDGNFFSEPLGTILHEAIHIGIEANIIEPNNIQQRMKERIVDQFMRLGFQHVVPNYQMQYGMDTSIDVIFNVPDVLDNLPGRVKDFLETKPDYQDAANIAASLATIDTPTLLEGIWVNIVSRSTGYAFKGNGFCVIEQGVPSATQRGTFTITSGKIIFLTASGGTWTQSYSVSNYVLTLEQVPGANYGNFTRQ